MEVGEIYEVIENSTAFASKLRAEAGKRKPGKQILDKAIRDDLRIRHAIWSRLKIGNEIPYTSIPNDLVYGAVIFMVHNSHYETLAVGI